MSFYRELLRDKSYKSYHLGLRAFASLGLLSPVLLVINAPHGRFSSDGASKTWITRAWDALSLDGTFSWIVMELPSPITLLYAFSQQSTLPGPSPLSLTPHSVLPLLFVGHYLNRAIISPLRTPSRSKSHLIVVLAAIVFNVINGSVTGTWLGAGARTGSIGWADTPVSYWVGLAMFGLGLWGNIWHDEVLLKIRKNRDGKKDDKPRYDIPYGGLYSLVSFPNYLCEWFEWTGFALASGSIMTPLQQSLTLGHYGGVYITPAVLFTLVEVALMLPRAQRGHEWYHEKFSDYPKDRKAVIPFLL
ncbi:3-oxo-5-alpha-steroid 4-dehydrogenase 1 [Rhizoctonia solani AG-1 IB]|uniref:3-oxo-5-alpha-steroid 4-dehydrogenase 1 n=1 Tax=Thanatephorus cucumeris (strain AG1-IB / isolate 7/3/14) TaxID=1108050 RepID=A0A0B7F9T7_THACB|nr:3-oxo-5-alpha-steroid 4-dehydrogenase 1 [Rhizoctonia solani AG-1 IB]